MNSSFRMQACTSPRVATKNARYATAASSTSGRHQWQSKEEEDDVQCSSTSMRYKLLDEREQLREAETVDRMIDELTVQRNARRPQSARQRQQQHAHTHTSGNTGSRRTSTTTPRRAVDRSMTSQELREPSKSPSLSRRASLNHSSSSASFQQQVVEELQRLKKAQQQDLEAIQTLQREKERAERKAQELEARFRAKSNESRSSAPQELVLDDDPSDDENNNNNVAFQDGIGDESLPPPQCDDEADWTNGNTLDSASSPELSPSKWSPQGTFSPYLIPCGQSFVVYDIGLLVSFSFLCLASVSPVFAKQRAKLKSHDFRCEGDSSSPSATQDVDSEEQLVQSWTSPPKLDDDPPQCRRGWEEHKPVTQNHPRPQTSKSRPQSPTTAATRMRERSRERKGSVEDPQRRLSCSFFEEQVLPYACMLAMHAILKQKAQEEELQRSREAAERLARAQKAQPPTRLLERQALALEKKQVQLQPLDAQVHAELTKDKKIKARDVPITTYVRIQKPGDDASAAVVVTLDEEEARRKERVRLRAQQLLASAELPPRMMASATGNGAASRRSRAQVEAKTKSVPDFDRLHSQWGKRLKACKTQASIQSSVLDNAGDAAATTPRKIQSREFFTSRATKLAELKAKKLARQQKRLQQEDAQRKAQHEAQLRLLEKVKSTAKPTKNAAGNNTMRGDPRPTKSEVLRVQKVLDTLARSQKQQEQLAREEESRQNKMRRAAQRVAAQVKASEQARLDGKSDYVSITEIDRVAKERARVPTVAQGKHHAQQTAHSGRRRGHVLAHGAGNLGVMKGTLTDEEHDLVRDIVASEDAEDKDDGIIAGGGRGKAKANAAKEDDDEDGYSDV
ncbi:hypothetical protein FI667_g11789, partial [Globisporangium splendens]